MPKLDRSRVSTANLLPVVVDGDYYGGTPRQRLPPVSAPLTPPPSYFNASPSSTKPVNPKTSYIHFDALFPKNLGAPSSPAASSSSSSSTTSSPMRTHDLYGRNSPRSLWSGSRHHNVKSSGCYASIIKVFLRDVK